VTVGNNTAEVVFVPTASAPKSLRVELALLGGNLESDVTRGENSGHKLRHDFTVLCLLAAPLRNVNGEFAAKVLLPAKVGDVPVALAAWVKPDDAQVPIQATGGWLTAR